MLTLAPTVLNDDPAEYQMILPALGVAHPTGYPLYTLLGYVFTRLAPFGDIAFRVNLFSAVASASAIAVLYRLLCTLRVAPLIALPGALAFAVSSDFWTYATIAQTYALNSLLLALTLWLFVLYQRRRDSRSLLPLAFVVGLGFAHHSTFWLLSPALALGALAMPEFRTQLVSQRIVKPILALALPLLLYLYIPVRGEQLRVAIAGDVLEYPRFITDGWVTPHYLAGWTNVVVGSFYASSTLEGARMDWLMPIAAYLWHLFLQFNVFVVLVPLCLVPIIRRQTAFVLMLMLGWLINIFIVIRGATAFDEPAGGLYTPTFLFCVILIVLSAQYLAQRVSTQGATALLILLCVSNLIWNVAAHVGGRQPNYRAIAQRQLSEALPSAVVLGSWSEVTPLHYLQIVEQTRLDVSVLHAPLTDESVRDMLRRAGNRPLYVLRPPDKLTRVSSP